MILKYGNSFTHPDGEAVPLALERQTVIGTRNRPMVEIRTLVAQIDVFADGAQAINSRLAQMEAGYFGLATEAGFCYSDGTQSKVWLPSNTLRNNEYVNLITPPSFAAQDSTEHVNHCTLMAQMQAEYMVAGDELIEFQESMAFEAESQDGKRYSPMVTDTGPVEMAILAQNTPRYITQSGYAIGRTTYPLTFPVPLLTLPMVRSYVRPVSGTNRGQRSLGFRVEWAFTFVSGVAMNIAANLPRTI